MKEGRALGQILKLIPSEHSQLGSTELPSAGAVSWRIPPLGSGDPPQGQRQCLVQGRGLPGSPPCPQAPQALRRDICIQNRDVVRELPAAQGQARSRSCCLRREPLGGCCGEGSTKGDVCTLQRGNLRLQEYRRRSTAIPEPESWGRKATALLFCQLLVPVGLPQPQQRGTSHGHPPAPLPSHTSAHTSGADPSPILQQEISQKPPKPHALALHVD